MNRPPPNRFAVEDLVAELELEELHGDQVGGPTMRKLTLDYSREYSDGSPAPKGIDVQLAPGLWTDGNRLVTTHELQEEMMHTVDNRPRCPKGHAKKKDRRGAWRCEVCREETRRTQRVRKELGYYPPYPKDLDGVRAAAGLEKAYGDVAEATFGVGKKTKGGGVIVDPYLRPNASAGEPVDASREQLEERIARLEKHVEVLQRRYLWVRDAWVKGITD